MPRPSLLALAHARHALAAAGVTAVEAFATVVAGVERDQRHELAELFAAFERWQQLTPRERLGLLLARCLSEPTPRFEDSDR